MFKNYLWVAPVTQQTDYYSAISCLALKVMLDYYLLARHANISVHSIVLSTTPCTPLQTEIQRLCCCVCQLLNDFLPEFAMNQLST